MEILHYTKGLKIYLRNNLTENCEITAKNLMKKTCERSLQ